MQQSRVPALLRDPPGEAAAGFTTHAGILITSATLRVPASCMRSCYSRRKECISCRPIREEGFCRYSVGSCGRADGMRVTCRQLGCVSESPCTFRQLCALYVPTFESSPNGVHFSHASLVKAAVAAYL